MSSRCKNCGGILEYDIALAKVKCQHCDSLFEPEEFDQKTGAEEYENAEQYETTVFMCPCCGAEISNSQYDIVDYCMYCGSFVSLESKLAQVERPKTIIPFKKTKEDCKKSYRDSLRYRLYAPSEFRDEKFLDGFRGIYIPFWNFQYKCGPKITIRGEKDDGRDGDYVKIQEYETEANFSANLNHLAYDASSSFDDEISLRIAPFSKEAMKPFKTSYMFGFYGDIADVDKKVYQAEADQEIGEQLWNSVTNTSEAKKSHAKSEVPSTIMEDFKVKVKSNMTMLPVWFLTWRKGNRLAYSVVNGETGECYSETPISIMRYLLLSLLTAVPIFFGLNMAVTFTASEMLILAMLLSFFMIMLYVFQLDKIVRRVMHTDDRGFLEINKAAKAAAEQVTENFITMTWNELCDFVKESFWYIPLIIIVLIVKYEFTVMGLIIVILGTPGYTLYRLWGNASILKDRSIYLDVLGTMLAILFSAGILIYDPAPDYYYYGSAMACMAGVAFAAVRMVNRYNQLLTRPVPHFFRKGERA